MEGTACLQRECFCDHLPNFDEKDLKDSLGHLRLEEDALYLVKAPYPRGVLHVLEDRGG